MKSLKKLVLSALCASTILSGIEFSVQAETIAEGSITEATLLPIKSVSTIQLILRKSLQKMMVFNLMMRILLSR